MGLLTSLRTCQVHHCLRAFPKEASFARFPHDLLPPLSGLCSSTVFWIDFPLTILFKMVTSTLPNILLLLSWYIFLNSTCCYLTCYAFHIHSVCCLRILSSMRSGVCTDFVYCYIPQCWELCLTHGRLSINLLSGWMDEYNLLQELQ